MPITLDVTPEMEQQLREQAAQTGKTPEQAALDALIAGLRNRKIPQTLADLPQNRPLPSGRSMQELMQTPWPGEETDAELLAALKAMDE